jgi:hypothetical protein
VPYLRAVAPCSPCAAHAMCNGTGCLPPEFSVALCHRSARSIPVAAPDRQLVFMKDRYVCRQ